MPNQTKVFVQEAGYKDSTFAQVLMDLNRTDVGPLVPEIRLRAARTLGALGILATDAIPSLENIAFQGTDITLMQTCLAALEKISPTYRDSGKHHGIHARLSALKNQQQLTAKIEPTTPPAKKMMNEIQIVQADGALGAMMSRKCNFCEKETIAQSEVQRLTEKLCLPNKFFCNFCLRHNLHMKDNKHVLMMTFRSVFGYFFFEYYQTPKQPTMYLSEIKDYIDLHRDIGMLNPIFNYDPESYVWFIDFRRVGSGKKKIDLEDVQKTVISILASFNLATTIQGIDMNKLYQKYREAVDDFYTKRYRPDGKRLLAPTLKGCGNVPWGGINQVHWQTQQIQQQQSQKMTLEDTKNFCPSLIEPSKYWQKTAVL
jgi:hypothetical protein